MSIAIIFNHKNPETWLKALQENLPGQLIEVYPNISNPDQVDFALCWKADKDVLNKFPNLKVIHSVGAAVDHITKFQEIKSDQHVCRIVDPQLSSDMFEFVLSVMMAQLKNLSFYQQQQLEKLWSPKAYRNIGDVVVGILGLGEIGKVVAKRLRDVGFKVKGWSNSEKKIKKVESYAGMDELSDFLAGTDFLVNLLPVTKATENLLNKVHLKLINKGAFLINTGRGEHLVEKDLIELLDEDHLSGALLDVFKVEPLTKEHPFWEHPKINITPHIASITNINTAVLLVAENYHHHLAGRPLKQVVDLEKEY
ncbi:MAG: glyoxylate/hydroxypyruvate reductase A [Pelobium sp.]